MTDAPLILLASVSPGNLKVLRQVFEKEGYRTLGASTIADLERYINWDESISLALLDLDGFSASIWEKCEQLRNNAVPFFLISARTSNAVQSTSMAQLGRNFLTKPVAINNLMRMVRDLLGAPP